MEGGETFFKKLVVGSLGIAISLIKSNMEGTQNSIEAKFIENLK
jgi:hypothetical protein